MATSRTPIAYPEWTEYRKKNGLDPLGMQTSSVSLYQTLLPGISNVTLRMRYYGFYVWLCRAYAQEIGDQNPETWKRIVRRAEALYALIGFKHGNENGVAGIQWAERILTESKAKKIDFASYAEPGAETRYLKQAWGAYGAAYASQLYEVGIFAATEGHDIPVPGMPLGEALADAFQSAVGDLAAKFFAIVQRGSVSRDDLSALSPLSPSEIARNGRERSCYERVLFGRAGLDREADRERRRTLSLVLRVAEQLGRIPSSSDIRWLLYAGYDADGTAFSLNEELSVQRVRWCVYQANDMTHICYETLLKFCLDILSAHPAGLTLERLIEDAVSGIRSSADRWPSSWGQFATYNKTDDARAEQQLCKSALDGARWGRVCEPQTAWGALRLLAVVQNRAEAFGRVTRDDLQALNPNAFRSLLTELEFLERHAKYDFASTLSKLIEQRVIRRHLGVALRKLRYQGDYTFLIEADDGRVRLRAEDGPVFTNPRLGPAVSFLEDIYLIDERGLTVKGKKVLEAA